MKYYLISILVLGCIFGCVWCFNHVNAWAGIGATLLSIGITILLINKKLKK